MTYIPSEEYILYLNSLSINQLEKLLYKDYWDHSHTYLFPNIKREDYQLIREILHRKYLETPNE
jgi:hypothetical protein